jgi:hypothetical protein
MDPEVKEAVTGLLLARRDVDGYGEEKVTRDLVTDGLAVDKVPKRRQISNYKYQLSKKMAGNYRPDVAFNQISAVVNAHKWTEGMADHKPFAFCSNVDENGNIDPGSGYVNEPFYVGFTSRLLLEKLKQAHQLQAEGRFPLVFQFDATYKVIALSFTDCRS